MLERWRLIFILQLLSKFVSVVTVELEMLKRSCCAEDTKFMMYDGEMMSCVSKSDENIRYGLNINCTSAEAIIIMNVTEIDDLDRLVDHCYIEQDENDTQNTNDTFLIGKCKEDVWHSEIDTYFVPMSIVCLFITLVVYIRISTLRQPEDIAFIIFILLLTLFLSLETILELFKNIIDETSQLVISFVRYYTNLGSFVWLNVILVCQLRKNM